ncbi:MAG: aminotransferase class V-fold PLP-dependent enzyme, partial [Planctomycetota bacterium]
ARAHEVAFVSGATEGLNLALRALLRPGDRVLTTALEHSSVVRPLLALARECSLTLDRLPPDASGGVDLAAAAAAVRTKPALLVFTHASNVTGAVLDAAALCELARAAGTRTLLDASQTAGHLDLRVGADVIVASGHKALHGPPGIGFVAARGIALPSQKQGGTGSSRALATHPEQWPDAFEAGTPNTPAIFGLLAAVQERPATVQAVELAATLRRVDRLAQALRSIPGVRTFEPRTNQRVPVLSCVHERFDAAELGALLATIDVHVRAGHHCAPWLHDHLGTAVGGTLRLSPGPATTDADVDAVAAFLAGL